MTALLHVYGTSMCTINFSKNKNKPNLSAVTKTISLSWQHFKTNIIRKSKYCIPCIKGERFNTMSKSQLILLTIFFGKIKKVSWHFFRHPLMCCTHGNLMKIIVIMFMLIILRLRTFPVPKGDQCIKIGRPVSSPADRASVGWVGCIILDNPRVKN